MPFDAYFLEQAMIKSKIQVKVKAKEAEQVENRRTTNTTPKKTRNLVRFTQEKPGRHG